MKNWLLNKLRKITLMLSLPGGFRAWRKGHYLDVYNFVYRLKRMDINPKTVIDIGANRGMFSKTIHYVYPEAKIYAFEPLKDCFEELNKLSQAIPSIKCYNVALSDHQGETVIHRSSSDYSSSLLEMNALHKSAFPHTAGSFDEAVSMSTLDSILGNEDLQGPILLKIDVQGYEKFVLDGAANILKKTDVIICEMSFRSLYHGQALFHDLYSFLITNGFNYRGNVGELINPLTHEMLQIDGLFYSQNKNV